MDEHILAEIIRLKALAYDAYMGLNAIEQTLIEFDYSEDDINHEPDFVSVKAPLMFDGVFDVNIPGEETLVFTFANGSKDTIHFSNEFSKPYVFGRIMDINGKKLEGHIKLVVENIDEKNFTVLSASTEKINFSHPAKEQGRFRIDSEYGLPLMPGGNLKVYLNSNAIMDTTNSKLVIEDLMFIAGGTTDVE